MRSRLHVIRALSVALINIPMIDLRMMLPLMAVLVCITTGCPLGIGPGALIGSIPHRKPPVPPSLSDSFRAELGTVGVVVLSPESGVMGANQVLQPIGRTLDEPTIEAIKLTLLQNILREASTQAGMSLIPLTASEAAAAKINREVKTVLEITLSQIGIEDAGVEFWHSAEAANMYVRLRILSEGWGTGYDFEWRCSRGNHKMSTWMMKEGQALLGALEQCSAILAETFVDEVFLVERDTNPDVVLSPKHNVYPKSPPWRSTLKSLTPTLEWVPLPLPDIIYGDVRYEVRIWQLENEVPGSLIYSKAGLRETFHTISDPLLPSTKYLWAIRARYTREGKPRLTGWNCLSQELVPNRYCFGFQTPPN